MKSNRPFSASIIILSVLAVVSVVYLRQRAPSRLPPVTTQAVIPTNSLATIESKATHLPALTITTATSRSNHSSPQLQLVKELVDLTDEQAKKLEPVLQVQQKRLAAFRRETSLSRAQRMARLKEMHETNDAQFKSILTPEQFEKWRKRGLELQKALQTEVGSK